MLAQLPVAQWGLERKCRPCWLSQHGPPPAAQNLQLGQRDGRTASWLTSGGMEPRGCQPLCSNSTRPIPFAPLPIPAMASQEFLPGQKGGDEGGTKGQCGGDAERLLGPGFHPTGWTRFPVTHAHCM